LSQEITIIVMIDTVGGINANSLDGYIYLVDNLRTEGSTGVGTGQLTSAVNGQHWSDGSQASEIVMNWAVTGISSPPLTLPRNYQTDRSHTIEAEALAKLNATVERLETFGSEGSSVNNLQKIRTERGINALVKNKNGGTSDLGLKLLDLQGRVVPLELTTSYQSRIREPKLESSDFSQFWPKMTNITGEAVDKGILFPAQYGSPLSMNDGWYWSASASTHKPGIYSYTMQFTLYSLTFIDGHAVWEPKDMTYDAKIRVTSNSKTNGFTKGAIGMLPIPKHRIYEEGSSVSMEYSE